MLNEQATSKFNDMLRGITDAADDTNAAPKAASNTFAGTRNVNIVCQTLVIGSLQELVDAIKDQAA